MHLDPSVPYRLARSKGINRGPARDPYFAILDLHLSRACLGPRIDSMCYYQQGTSKQCLGFHQHAGGVGFFSSSH